MVYGHHAQPVKTDKDDLFIALRKNVFEQRQLWIPAFPAKVRRQACRNSQIEIFVIRQDVWI